MAIESAQVAVSTTAAKLTTAILQTAGKIQLIKVQAPAAAALLVGPVGVTAANGFSIAAAQTHTFELAYGEELYGILATGTGTAFVLRTGV